MAFNLALLAALAMSSANPAKAVSKDCTGLPPDKNDRRTAVRSVTTADLIGLRDVGGAGNAPGENVFSISPDGRHLAFQLRRADADTNAYCIGIYVLDLDGTHGLRAIDHGGDLITLIFDSVMGLRPSVLG